MKGVEGTGAAGAGREAELSGTPIDAPKVQIALALAAYAKIRNRTDINPSNWEQNDEATQNAAMMEWVNADENRQSPSSRYRAYLEKYPHKRIDLTDKQSIEELLAEIAAE